MYERPGKLKENLYLLNILLLLAMQKLKLIRIKHHLCAIATG